MADQKRIDWTGYGVMIGKRGSGVLALSSAGIACYPTRRQANAFARELRAHRIRPCRVVPIRMRVNVLPPAGEEG